MRITNRIEARKAKLFEHGYYLYPGNFILQKFSDIVPVPERMKVYNLNKKIIFAKGSFWVTVDKDNCYIVDWPY